MISFLADILFNRAEESTVVVFEDDGARETRRYDVRPHHIRWLLGGTVFVLFCVATIGVIYSPIESIVRGRNYDRLQQMAQYNRQQVVALQESLYVQRRYARHLSALITGEMDSSLQAVMEREDGEASGREVEGGKGSAQTVVLSGLSAVESGAPGRGVSSTVISGGSDPLWPAPPPVDGFVTRGFSAEQSHLAVDVATETGTTVRSVAPGYVILADWTQEGGYVIAVQHSGGYISIYKHNSRLLKQVGDRVRSREVIAETGNAGTATTGPHLHFELWKDGIARNPHRYITDW